MINTIQNIDCLEGMKGLADCSVDCCVTDPPYGISFMGKKWDYQIPSVEIWKEVFRVLKPGAHILVACGTRTQHRMTVNIEDAGFEIRDVITWHYGSGFPKSMDISKAIDKQAGAEREVIAEGKPVKRMIPGADQDKTGSWIKDNGRAFVPTETAPSTDEAKQWEGWGTALKPATEFWTLARKPIGENTVADNVIKYGTGGLNIDACRIESDDKWNRNNNVESGLNGEFLKGEKPILRMQNDAGRFPANLILDEFAAGELDKQSGVLKSGSSTGNRTQPNTKTVYGSFKLKNEMPREGSEGGASRFFYIAKADGEERESHNNHPTVKPLRLMQYLIRLVCPPDGIVLEPFAGSGTTCIAARKEDKRFIGFELNPDYIKIAETRLKNQIGMFL